MRNYIKLPIKIRLTQNRESRSTFLEKNQNIPLSVGRACHVWKHRLKATHMRDGGKGKKKKKKKPC